MTAIRRVAVTGATGRLGSALRARLTGAPTTRVLPWARPDYDLDDPDAAARCIARDRPDLVLHAAAWTDVDGCARDPEAARRRNADAVGALARACAATGTGLLLVSTNEVFGAPRADGAGWREDDPVAPGNAYGASKAEGEAAARAAMPGPGLWIVRTAWLYGRPGAGFPERIVAAADRLPPGEALPVVADEIGSPTWAADLADAILALVGAAPGGTFHCVNGGAVSRRAWADAVLAVRRPERRTRPIGRAEFVRASVPPAWAVLDTARAAAAGVRLRAWDAALAAYLATEP